jgi:heme oxygenase (biliverdin-producing, ferredoxin)
MSEVLSVRLREGTKASHRSAESTNFVRCFIKGYIDKQSYCKLLANLYFVYSVMEEEAERHRQHPVIRPLYLPELHRRMALEKDLAFYYDACWKEQVAPTPAGEAYVQAIRAASARDPALLVAHMYTRYLGDLSGGQVLKTRVQKAMGLSDGAGVAFYDFKDIPDGKTFKEKYRRALDMLPVDEAMARRIVAESNAAFGYNMELFNELDADLARALGQDRFDALTRRDEAQEPTA